MCCVACEVNIVYVYVYVILCIYLYYVYVYICIYIFFWKDQKTRRWATLLLPLLHLQLLALPNLCLMLLLFNQSINQCYICSNEIHREFMPAIHRKSLIWLILTFLLL
jgi:hypothetical protein